MRLIENWMAIGAHKALLWAFEARARFGHDQSQLGAILKSRGGMSECCGLDFRAQSACILGLAQRVMTPAELALVTAWFSCEPEERKGAARACYELARPDEIGQAAAEELVWDWAKDGLPVEIQAKQQMLHCCRRWNMDRVAGEIGFPRAAFRIECGEIRGDLSRVFSSAMEKMDRAMYSRDRIAA